MKLTPLNVSVTYTVAMIYLLAFAIALSLARLGAP